jgi:hypothetical protein
VAEISAKRAEKKAHGYWMKSEEPWLFSRPRPGHRPRKPNPWRLGFLEPAGEREKQNISDAKNKFKDHK